MKIIDDFVYLKKMGWVVKRRKVRIKLVILFIVLSIMCFPIKYHYKDRGSISYKAILYSYTKYHKLEDDGSYFIDTEFLIFPFNFFK